MSGKRASRNIKSEKVSKTLRKSPKDALYESWVDEFRSDRKQIVTFFSKMLDACVYCRIITDDSGKPVDYIYLGVNDAYERLVGFKRDTLIGKNAIITDSIIGSVFI